MIESEWIPTYGPEGFSAVAVYTGEQPAFGQLIARYADIHYPMAWDMEFEVFNRHKIRGLVFPLRVLLDRDGNVSFKAAAGVGGAGKTGEDLTSTADAIEAALGL